MTCRSDAKSSGKTKYYTGKPCKNGHIDFRYTVSGTCQSCLTISDAKRSDKKDIYKRRWYAKNKEFVLQKRKEDWQINKNDPEYQNRKKQWVSDNKEKMLAYARAYRKRSAHVVCAATQRRNATKLQATPKWANEFYVSEAYHLAKLRSEVTGFKWHVDHIVPLRSDIVCGLHVEQNMRVIPAVDNIRKSNRYWDDMP